MSKFLQRSNSRNFWVCGLGDPEGFLYANDQTDTIDKIKANGGNAIYMQAIRGYGGDGASDEHPFTVGGAKDSGGSKTLDSTKMANWKTWFDEMDAAGIVTVLFIYDDSARVWNTGDSVGADEQAFLEDLVNEFKYLKNLIWVVAEEFSEAYTATRADNIAGVIRSNDKRHAIGVHQVPGYSFNSTFQSSANIDLFMIQGQNNATYAQVNTGCVSAFNEANGVWTCILSEATGWGTGITARRKSWAAGMAGMWVMNFLAMEYSISTLNTADMNDYKYQQYFMESIAYEDGSPDNSLITSGTAYCFVNEGTWLVFYAPTGGNITVDLSGFEGTLDYVWYNPSTGTYQGASTVSGGGSEVFSCPNSNDWVCKVTV